MSTKSLICYGVIGLIGVILIVVSMAGFAYFPALIESQIFKTLDITDQESEGYKNFVSTKFIKILIKRDRKLYYNHIQIQDKIDIIGHISC